MKDITEDQRERFNNILKSIDMVLMNKIPEVDPSIWESWESASPLHSCDVMEGSQHCTVHDKAVDGVHDDECEDAEEVEVYQWFAVSQNDADFLKRHNQYVTYSEMLDTYFLAICHFGTSWDYVDSMVRDFLSRGK